jgi:acyl-CoA thioesterase-1
VSFSSKFRLTVCFGGASLLLAITGVWLVVALGATVLAIEPTEPRDRAVPTSIQGEGPLRVTVLGTSLSSAGRYQWPDVVGARLSTRIGRPVEISRVTQSGATSAWGAGQINRVLKTNPDVVLVEFAVNDADARHLLTVGDSVARHERILTALKSGGHEPVVVLLTMNPAFGPRAWVRPFLSRYYEEYVGLSQRADTGLVDLFARWGVLPEAAYEMHDGLHPSDSAATHVIVGPVVDALANAIAPLPE